MLNRAGIDVPAEADREPEREDYPQNSVLVTDVGDVGVPVGKEVAILALRLLFEQVEEMGQGDLLALLAQFLADLGVHRRLFQAVDGEGGVGDVLLDLVEEVILEVVPRVKSVLPSEVVLGDEARRAGDGDVTGDQLENRDNRQIDSDLGRAEYFPKCLFQGLRVLDPPLSDARVDVFGEVLDHHRSEFENL